MPDTTTTLNPSLNSSQNKSLNHKRVFILYYHFRAAAPLTLVFEHQGDLRSAKERAELHCKRMNYRYIKVRSFIVDLDEREKKRNEEGFDQEEF